MCGGVGYDIHEERHILTATDILYIYKGYPTKEHIRAIHKLGASPIHRLSFKPLKGRGAIGVSGS